MPFFLVKLFVSAAIIATVSEIAKRSTLMGGIIGALPLVSILTFCWLYYDTKDSAAVAGLSWEILWFTLPSLSFFVALPIFLKYQIPFVPAVILAAAMMGVCIFLFGYAKRFV